MSTFNDRLGPEHLKHFGFDDPDQETSYFLSTVNAFVYALQRTLCMHEKYKSSCRFISFADSAFCWDDLPDEDEDFFSDIGTGNYRLLSDTDKREAIEMLRKYCVGFPLEANNPETRDNLRTAYELKYEHNSVFSARQYFQFPADETSTNLQEWDARLNANSENTHVYTEDHEIEALLDNL